LSEEKRDKSVAVFLFPPYFGVFKHEWVKNMREEEEREEEGGREKRMRRGRREVRGKVKYKYRLSCSLTGRAA
jgi:hypothetical protein